MPSPQKVVTVAYKRWSFTRRSNYRALTGKNLVLWIDGRLWKVDPYERWSHMEVQLYSLYLEILQQTSTCHLSTIYTLNNKIVTREH